MDSIPKEEVDSLAAQNVISQQPVDEPSDKTKLHPISIDSKLEDIQEILPKDFLLKKIERCQSQMTTVSTLQDKVEIEIEISQYKALLKGLWCDSETTFIKSFTAYHADKLKEQAVKDAINTLNTDELKAKATNSILQKIKGLSTDNAGIADAAVIYQAALAYLKENKCLLFNGESVQYFPTDEDRKKFEKKEYSVWHNSNACMNFRVGFKDFEKIWTPIYKIENEVCDGSDKKAKAALAKKLNDACRKGQGSSVEAMLGLTLVSSILFILSI